MRTIFSLFLICMFLACTKQEIIDTGISSPYYKGTIMKYLRSDDYNWKLTVQMIERAGMTAIFEGKDEEFKEITFLGPTSHSIIRHLYANKLDSVNQLSPEFCKQTILKHLIKGKFLKESVPFRDKQYQISASEQPADHYLKLNSIGGIEIRAYLEQQAFSQLAPNDGPIEMFLYSMTGKTLIPLASPNIQPSNGVVHSLNYNYILNNL